MSYVTEQEAREALERWTRQQRETAGQRDELVRAAVAAGVTRHQIHVITGLARTTINSILASEEQQR